MKSELLRSSLAMTPHGYAWKELGPEARTAVVAMAGAFVLNGAALGADELQSLRDLFSSAHTDRDFWAEHGFAALKAFLNEVRAVEEILANPPVLEPRD